MSDPTPKPTGPNQRAGPDSLNCVNLIIDDPEFDTTVRPMSPAIRKLILEQRERLARWQAEQERRADKPADDSSSNGGGG
jgi:hypothetical protein